MPVLDPIHDRMHPVEGDTAWSESYYFNGFCPDERIGLYTRIGIRPNEGTIDVMLGLWMPSGEVGFVRAKREQHEMCESPLRVGGITYTCTEPGEQWRLGGDPEARVFRPGTRDHRTAGVRFDLVFDALIPPIGVDGRSAPQAGSTASTSGSTGKGHLEQAGRWSGWIEIDGHRHVLGSGARGNRDKSWGPRRWGGPKMWRWFSINIDDDTHFGGIRIGTGNGDVHRGWVWKDGEHTSIREWRVRTETASDGVTQQAVHVTAVDKRDREHALRADVIQVFPGGGRKDATVVNEGLARWEYEGRIGYGIAEYLHQFDADGRPLVVIE